MLEYLATLFLLCTATGALLSLYLCIRYFLSNLSGTQVRFLSIMCNMDSNILVYSVFTAVLIISKN